VIGKWYDCATLWICQLTLLIACLAISCDRGAAQQDRAGTTPNTDGSSTVEPKAVRAPLAGERVEIPSGRLVVGSRPGTPGRQPNHEPASYAVELGSFEIDRLPYPNDPARPALTGATHDEAQRMCASSGSRLCTELEWERACKGPDNSPYPSGAHFDARCLTHPDRCKTGFDVLAMGVTHREWTASDRGSSNEVLWVARGSTMDAPDESHRCAARTPMPGSASDKNVAFRCCRGAPNAVRVKEPTQGKPYQKASLSPEHLKALMRSDPITLPLSEGVQFFREPEAAETVVSRGGGDKKGLTFSVAPTLWNPSVGVNLLVLVAHAKETSFVLVYNVVAKDEYGLTASFVMKSEPGPVALAFDDSIRTRLFFSTCWGCPGETGKILFREPESAAIVQP